jgi:hypothetical protein
MEKYQNTLIYKIICKDASIKDCYVGHTVNIKYREKQHKNNTKNEKGKPYHYKLYDFIRSNGGWDNFSMEIIEHYPCNNKNEALLKEQQTALELNATLGIKAQRTKEEEKEYKAKWFQENKERIKEKHTLEYICECGAVIQEHEKLRHFKSKNHICFMENKQKNLYPYTCSCGKSVISKKKRHEESAFHINNCKL